MENNNIKINLRAKSYNVISNSNCCEQCENISKNGNQWFDINDLSYFPPLHPNCRCTTTYSTKTAVEKVGEYNTTVHKSNYLNSLSHGKISRLDNMYEKSQPLEVQETHKIFSKDSNMLNDFVKAEGWNEELGNYWKISKFQYDLMINNFERSLTSLKEPTNLYKGISFSTKDADLNILRNDMNTFSSTSFDPAIAKGYAGKNGAVLVIHALKHTNGVYLRQYSHYPKHMEFTLGRNNHPTIFIKNNEIHVYWD
ncbi:MAG: hypothetical protein FWH29_00160 [Methanobrevibacter sp.]|nr:hypothetical protein [Methanobrevibacter sp.]